MSPNINDVDLKKCTKPKLVEIAADLGLDTSGTNKVLVERIEKATLSPIVEAELGETTEFIAEELPELPKIEDMTEDPTQARVYCYKQLVRVYSYEKHGEDFLSIAKGLVKKKNSQEPNAWSVK